MVLMKKTLEKLRVLINEGTEYRSGLKLVEFFNNLGFKDTYSYGGGFPSRWVYTDERLTSLNGKPELDQCIRSLFSPINFVGRIEELDKLISDFNMYLSFDGWNVIRNGKEITFKKTDQIDALKETKDAKEISEDEFLNHEFSDLPIAKIGLDGSLQPVIELRIEEIRKCMQAKAPLATVFLCGSTLEGLLLGVALQHPRQFNQSTATPKEKDGKPKAFQDWTLSNMIDVAADLEILKEDVKKFSHSLRDFRNYIHPYEQMTSRFNPDDQTAKISFQVLKAAIFQLATIQ